MILIGILLFLLSISAHELGHAYAMKRNRIPLREICILGFGPKLLVFHLRRWFGETPISIRLIPLGASVRPLEEDDPFGNLKFSQRTYIYGAGIIANFFLAGLFWIAVCVLINDFHHRFWIAVGLMVIGVLPKISSYLIPCIGIFFLAFLVYFTFSRPLKQFQEDNGSVVLITQEIHKAAADDHQTPLNIRLAKVVNLAAIISFSLAIFNSFPLSILDGGKIFQDIITSRFRKRRRLAIYIFQIMTAIPLLAFILSALSADVVRLVKLIF